MKSGTSNIVVVGGGVAGAIACLRLLQNGFVPIWIADQIAASDKPGEHLAPAARPLLSEVNAVELIDRCYHLEANAMFSSWGSAQLSDRSAILHLEGAAAVLDSRRFEADLRELACQRGVEPLASTALNATLLGKNWHISLDDRRIIADYLIDGTGRQSSCVGKLSTHFRADRLCAAVGFCEQKADCEVEPTRATLVEAVAEGWWYAALLPDRRLVLNYYSDSDLLVEGLHRDLAAWNRLIDATIHIRRWIDEAGFEITVPPRIHSATTSWLAPCSGERWVAVGDAAAAFDPLSSHGMTTAIWTAIAGADAIASSLTGDIEASRRYSLKVSLGLQDFLQSRQKIYNLEQRFASHTFWRRRQATD